ncbi:MAG: hypothetical protein F2663_06765 [Actinobacteria bacterium]|uniref:Unannotated protein n=1 Tax=freshwater metagenome TaxID=449393 RepID=A0A6J6PX99_9ZZZZ|nr:hypothetical protein [Actinomycetota bacterium]
MRTRLLSVVSLATAAVISATLVAGCGGAKVAKLTDQDVAVAGPAHVTKAAYQELLNQSKAYYKSQKRVFPKAGSTEFQTIKNQAISQLVQAAERENEATSMGIEVTDKQVTDRLAQIKKQYFGGSEKQYQSQIKAQGLTDAQVRTDVRQQLISEGVFNKITKDVSVSDADINAYYVAHPEQYKATPSRAVRYILVGKNQTTLAASILSQLKSGTDAKWCSLAKQYSKDPSSSGTCGKASFTKGQTVSKFDALLFSLKTGETASVNTPEYGWFVLEPTADASAGTATPQKQVADTIKQQLVQEKKNQLMTDWVNKLSKSYCTGNKVKYQIGFAPSPDPCATFTASTQTT